MKRTSVQREKNARKNENRRFAWFKTLAKRSAQALLVGALFFGTWDGMAEAQETVTRGRFTLQISAGFSPDQVAALTRGVEYWAQLSPTGNNFTYTVELADLGDYVDGRITVASSSRTGVTFNNNASANLIARYSDESNTQIKQLPGTTSFNWEDVLIHELGHPMGFWSSDTGSPLTGFSNNANNYTRLLHDGSRFGASNLQFTNPAGANYFDTANVTFRGSDAMNVFGDNWVGVAAGGTATPVPIVPGTRSGSSLSHVNERIALQYETQQGNGRPFYSEVELAIFNDADDVNMPNNIDIRNFFGRSVYQSGTSATNRRVIVNTDGFSARNAVGTAYVAGDNTSTYGIGLHIVGNFNDVTQSASLLAAGYAGAGARVEGQGNLLRINNGVVVRGNGEEGVGVLVTHGSSTTLVNRGTIEATGTNGRGVWFNGDATTFDNTGIINAGTNNAIYIGNGSRVGAINIMAGSTIIGDIVNDGNSTTLSFGKKADTNGEATENADNGFFLTYNDNITGDGKFDLQTWGGYTWLAGNTLESFRNGLVKQDSVLDLDGIGTVKFSGTLTLEQDGTLTAHDNERSLSINVLQNSGNVLDFNALLSKEQIENELDGVIKDNNSIETDTYLMNYGLIENNATITTKTSLNNYATGTIIGSWKITTGTSLYNNGLIDDVNDIKVGGYLDNSTNGIIQNVTSIEVKDNTYNSGTIDRFTNFDAKQDFFNENNGYVHVNQTGTLNVGQGMENSAVLIANGLVNITQQYDNTNFGWTAGAGTIKTSTGFVNSGVIAPGNQPGVGNGKAIDTLSINGEFINTDGAMYIEIDPSHYPGQAFAGLHNDLIDVTGTGVIDGGMVAVIAPSNDKSVNPTPPRYVGNTKYTFLDTTGGLDVQNELVSQEIREIVLFDFLPEHDAKSYWLNVQREYYYGPYGDTFNQTALGNYIDEIGLDPDPNGDFFDVLLGLDNLNKAAGIPHRAGISRAAKFSLDQMSGAIYGTQANASIQNTTIVNNTLADVLRKDSFRGKLCETKRNLWGLGYGVGGSTQYDGNAYGYDHSFGGTIIGFDRNLNKNLRLGGFFSYGEGNIKSDLIEKSKSNEFLGGIYLRTEMQNGYLAGNAGLGNNRYDTERTISFVGRKAKNKHNAILGTVYFERGFELKAKYGTWQPFFGMQYVGMQQENFTEHGAGSLNLVAEKCDAHSLRSMLGTRFELKPVNFRGGSLSFNGNATWMHEYMSRSYTNFAAKFSNPGYSNFSSDAGFTVRGNDSKRDWAILGLGLNYDCNRLRLFAGYDAYINDQQVLHTGNLGLAYTW